MKQQKIRKNNNERFAWYLDQREVNYIIQLENEGKAQFGYPYCRVAYDKEYVILTDSDNKIRGLRLRNTGEYIIFYE